MTMRFALMVSLALVASAVPALARPALAHQFAKEASLDIRGDGLAMLVLPAEVLAAARPDLADVRITDRAGREVPFFVQGSRSPADPRRPVAARILDVEQLHTPRSNSFPELRERYQLASIRESLAALGLPYLESEAWAIEVVCDRTEFVARIHVSTPAEPDLVRDAPLFRVGGAERIQTALPPHAGELTLWIESVQRSAEFLKPTFHFVPIAAAQRAAPAVVPFSDADSQTSGGVTELRLARPLGLVPSALRFDADDDAFARRVSVVDLLPAGRSSVLGEAAIVRVTRDASSLDVPLRVSARGVALLVRIEDRDSAPLRNPRVSALVQQPALVFALADAGDAQPDGTLHFGGAQALRPNYDLASLAELFPNPALLDRSLASIDPAATTLGSIRSNPSFAPTPALEFAMQPGAPLDARRFRLRRALTIAPTPNGLSRYRLAPEDVASARPDLADLRVAGADGAQWPLLLAPDAAREWRDTPMTTLRGPARESRYALALPAEGVRVTALELDTQAPFFDRAYRVATRAANDHEIVLATGRVVRAPERLLPVRIALPGERIANLELAIEDGDDAPLEFSHASAQVVLPELFVTALPGEYALLLGDPDASAPRYELERVRELVLAVPSGGVQAGALEANPAFSAARSLAFGLRGRTLAVWVVLGVAVAVLAALTLRAARREDPDPPAG
jgi:hypothetical protein